MSRSARRPKPKRPGDGCFFCDPVALEAHRRKLATAAAVADMRTDMTSGNDDAQTDRSSPVGNPGVDQPATGAKTPTTTTPARGPEEAGAFIECGQGACWTGHCSLHRSAPDGGPAK